MSVDQIIIMVLTYLGGIALKKWPEFKNEYIPRAAWVVSILAVVVQNWMNLGTAPQPVVAPAAFAAIGVPVEQAQTAASDLAMAWAGTKIFLGTQVLALFDKIVLKGLLKVKLPW